MNSVENIFEIQETVISPSTGALPTTTSFSMSSIIYTLPIVPVECARRRRERMSSSRSGHGQQFHYPQQHQYQHQHPQAQPRWSLNDLSTELLALIFEQVCGSRPGCTTRPGLGSVQHPRQCRRPDFADFRPPIASRSGSSICCHGSSPLPTVQPDSHPHCLQDIHPQRAGYFPPC